MTTKAKSGPQSGREKTKPDKASEARAGRKSSKPLESHRPRRSGNEAAQAPMARRAKEAEERNRIIAEMIPDYAYTFLVTPEGELKGEWVTESFTKVFGYTLKEVQARGGWMTLVYPQDLPIARAHAQKVTRGEADTCEMRWVTARGEIRWLRDYAKPMFDEAGKRVVRIYGASQDITERKRAEEQLIISEARLRATLYSIGDAVVATDDAGRVTMMNPIAEKLTGWTETEALLQPLEQVFHIVNEETRILLENPVQRVLREGIVIGLANHTLLIARGGSEYPIADAGAPIRDASGRIAGVVLVFRDQTAERAAQRAVQDARLFAESIIATVREPLLVLDAELRVVSANRSFYRIFEVAPEETIGRFVYELGNRQWDIPDLRRLLEDILPQNTQFNDYEVMHEFERIGKRTMLLNARRVYREANKTQLILLAIEDVTERMRAEGKIRQQVQRLTALWEVDRAIASSFDSQPSLNILLSRALKLLDVDAAAVLRMNAGTNTLEYAAGLGFRTVAVKTASVKLGESYAGRAALERRMVGIPNLGKEPGNLLLTDFLKGENFVSYYGTPLIIKGKVIGVLEVFSRSVVDRDRDWLDFLSMLAGQAAIAMDNSHLFAELQRSNVELAVAYDATIEGWSRALDLRDKETEGHTQRVTEMTLRLAEVMGIGPEERVHIRRGALLHDIGKMGVPDSILHKPGGLTEEEWVIMHRHPVYAYEMLQSIEYLRAALDIPYCHHEKWDGTGYPRGLAGDRIPLAARIFAVVDVWDALRSDRPYRPAWPVEEAREYLQEQAGKHFDPNVVKVFLSLFAKG